MKPVNNKSLLHFLFDQMEKLNKGEITNEQAKSQATLAKQVNNAMMYEVKRADVLMKIKQHNKDNGDSVELREIEGISF